METNKEILMLSSLLESEQIFSKKMVSIYKKQVFFLKFVITILK
jgi:hypothetical protein